MDKNWFSIESENNVNIQLVKKKSKFNITNSSPNHRNINNPFSPLLIFNYLELIELKFSLLDYFLNRLLKTTLGEFTIGMITRHPEIHWEGVERALNDLLT